MLNKITTFIPRFNKGFEAMGAVKRPKDTRNLGELVSTIQHFSSGVKEMPDIKKINPRHLGLFADTLELAQRHEMMNGNINFNAKFSNGKTILEQLLQKMAAASKNNHKGLDFASDVINNTDTIVSKRFLAELSASDVLEKAETSGKFEAARALIPDIAKSTLKPPYFVNNSLDDFMLFIKILTSPNAKTDKVALLKNFADTVSKSFKTNKQIDVAKFVNSNAPLERTAENIKTLEQLAPIEKNLDVTDFVLNNVNLK